MANNFIKWSFILLVLNIVSAFCDYCPDPTLLNPCKCEDKENGIIRCTGHEFYNLKKIFHALNSGLDDRKKHFSEFLLNNTAITELTENTFSDITFDRILIYEAINLKHIHSHAFSATSLATTSFVAYNTSLENSLPYNDIFTALSLFRNLKTLSISISNLNSIPKDAFRPLIGSQTNLTKVDFSMNKIESVGENAFHYLDSLVSIDLSWNQINSISESAFSFLKASNKHINIVLYHNKLVDTSFQVGAFNTFDRPAKLNLDMNNIKSLNRYVFSKFLECNSTNQIAYTHLDCSDCHSFWLLENGKYNKQLQLLKCSNNRTLLDNANFVDCVHFFNLK